MRNRPWRAVAAPPCRRRSRCSPRLPAAAGTNVGGDPDTLAYFEQHVKDWESVPAARVTEYGLFYLFYNGGTAVNYRWGVTHPTGFKAAKAVIDYWLDGGKIVALPRDRDRPRHPAAEDPRRRSERLRLDDDVLGSLQPERRTLRHR